MESLITKTLYCFENLNYATRLFNCLFCFPEVSLLDESSMGSFSKHRTLISLPWDTIPLLVELTRSNVGQSESVSSSPIHSTLVTKTGNSGILVKIEVMWKR